MKFMSRAEVALFGIGLVSLMYELAQVRLLAFFLGNNMDFLAIPIALLGLAAGSMWCHFRYRGTPERLLSVGLTATLPVMALVLMGLFFIGNTYFDEINVARGHPYEDGWRLVVYSLIFLPPYMIFGAMLSSLFANAGDRIGRYYFFDLAGAALGCVVTPLLFTYTDLQPTLLILLGFAGALALIPESERLLRMIGIGGTWAAVFALTLLGEALHEKPDPSVLVLYAPKELRKVGMKEVGVRWNEIARTSLVRAGRPGKSEVSYSIVQDNGLSNVIVKPYRPEWDRSYYLDKTFHHSLAWRLGREPESVLVVFAGLGRDMIIFNALSEGGEVVGVEINGAVVDLVDHPALESYNLQAFHALPNIDLNVREGRDYLNNSEETFELIHVANNGAVSSSKTGHTRKFLDTCQAMGAYLDHLHPDGMLVFSNQPVGEKISCFRDLLAERGLASAEDALWVYGREKVPNLDTLVVMPKGFSDRDLQILSETGDRREPQNDVLIARGVEGSPRLAFRMSVETDDAHAVTDDKPFHRRVTWANFKLQPTEKELKNPAFVSSWIKIFSVAFFTVVSGFVGLSAVAMGGKEGRVPLPWLFYFGTAGIAYMCVQIGLIAKTELFIGNPLYAVAVNLAAFLIFNAMGALTQDRFRDRNNPVLLAGATVVGIGWGVVVAGICGTQLLSAPFPLKIVGVAIAVLPPAMALGAWYPFGVHALVRSGKESAVPITYALSTLSSVLGSVFAMTAIINLGFSTVIALGALGYAIAGIIAWTARD